MIDYWSLHSDAGKHENRCDAKCKQKLNIAYIMMHCSGFYYLQFLTTVKNRVATPLRPFGGVTTALSHRHYGPLRAPLGRFHFVTTAHAPVELTPIETNFNSQDAVYR